MELWQKLENHEKSCRRVLSEQGCLDSKKRLRQWRPTTWPALKEAGHDSLDFDKCKCKNQ